MATQKQTEANRRNAQKSTGPKTPEGKAAIRFNALRLGLRASTLLLPWESGEDWMQLCDDLDGEWQPKSRTEQFYLERMAASQWKLHRMEIGEKSLYAGKSGKEQLSLLFQPIWQEQCRLERSYTRAQRELERLQKSRRQPVQPAEEVPDWAVRVKADNELAESIPGIGDQVVHGPHLSAAHVFQGTRESPSVEELACPLKG